ncbi:MAG: insulinase family protein [Flavobacteriales bacterium]|nr:insulinase family protein [Flavobacteriales bacterium]MCX7650718.1 insulinase family protein [Flavobacteriales bacterium]MDW8432185.1 insulinase family protein [Flavobacteriales bacterium]
MESVSATPGRLNIPYKKFLLPNGLTVLVHEDHSDPVVYVDVTYHVGSGCEIYGRSGFAHFFEHMMFQGSDHVGDEEHFRIVTEAGGTLNGTTNTDRTNYFETLPSNQLEVALWLESDRMGWFLDAVTKEKFEVQRATVKNERGQNYDNAPYGLVNEKLREGLYPFNHPYSWTTIGYIEDLNAATLDDLKRFFLRWYGPNNAILTVAGDVKAEEVASLAAKYFGEIPSGPAVKKPAPQPVKLENDRFISYEDNVKMPLIKMVWPTVEQTHADALALDAVAFALGQGKSSPLYQKLVKARLAQSASAYHPTFERAGQMEVTVYALPGHDLKKIRAVILETVQELAQKGISAETLQRFKNVSEASAINNLRTVQGKGSLLAFYGTFFETPDYLPRYLEALQKLTAEQVNTALKKYVAGQYSLTVSCIPKGKSDLLPASDNVSRPKAPAGFKPDLTEYQNLTYKKPKSSFDRSQKPVPGPAPVVATPDFQEAVSPAGSNFIVTRYDELPVTDILVSVAGGQAMEMASKAGLTALTATLMRESTENYSAEALSDELENLGCNLSVSSERDEFNISLSCLNKNLDKGLVLLKEVLFQPAFKEDEFERAKERQLQSIRNQKVNARSVAQAVLRRRSYPENMGAAFPDLGTESTVASLNLMDVRMRHQMLLMKPENATVAIVGALPPKEVPQKMDFLWKWDTRFKRPGGPSGEQPQGAPSAEAGWPERSASEQGIRRPPRPSQPGAPPSPPARDPAPPPARLSQPPGVTAAPSDSSGRPQNPSRPRFKVPLVPFRPQEKTTLFFAHKDNAAQSEILMGMKGVPFSPIGEAFMCRMINFPLGGAFNSRLNVNLREKRGYTYGIRSGFSSSKYFDVWTCAAGVKKEATDTALSEILREISAYAEKGMTQEELQFTKSALLQSDALKYESPGQKAAFLKMLADFDYNREIPKIQKDLVNRLNLETAAKKAKVHFSNKPLTIVVVGDRETVLPRLKRLGIPIVEVDAEGLPLAGQ